MTAVHIASGLRTSLVLQTTEHPLLPGVSPVLVTQWGWPVDHRTWAVGFCDLDATQQEKLMLTSAGFSALDRRYGERCRNCGHVWFRSLLVRSRRGAVCPVCRLQNVNEGLPSEKRRRRKAGVW